MFRSISHHPCILLRNWICLLAKSGGLEVLIEKGMLAPGSCNGLNSDRHYNWYQRLHPLLANYMHILHFRSFFIRSWPSASRIYGTTEYTAWGFITIDYLRSILLMQLSCKSMIISLNLVVVVIMVQQQHPG